MLLDRIGAIEKVASQEETRFALKHLYFDAEHGRLCATNGHALIVCECQAEEGDVSGLISVEALQAYRKFRKDNSLANTVKFHALKNVLVVEDLVEGKKFSFRRPEGTFPSYEHIMPQIAEGTPPSVTFDPKLLQTIAEAFPVEESGGKTSSVSIWLLPAHRGRSRAQIDEAKSKGTPLDSIPAILVKAHHQGGIALLMGMNYAIGEDKWNTNLPGLPEKKAVTDKKKPAEKKPPVPTPAKKPPSPARPEPQPEPVEKVVRPI